MGMGWLAQIENVDCINLLTRSAQMLQQDRATSVPDTQVRQIARDSMCLLDLVDKHEYRRLMTGQPTANVVQVGDVRPCRAIVFDPLENIERTVLSHILVSSI